MHLRGACRAHGRAVRQIFLSCDGDADTHLTHVSDVTAHARALPLGTRPAQIPKRSKALTVTPSHIDLTAGQTTIPSITRNGYWRIGQGALVRAGRGARGATFAARDRSSEGGASHARLLRRLRRVMDRDRGRRHRGHRQLPGLSVDGDGGRLRILRDGTGGDGAVVLRRRPGNGHRRAAGK